MAEVELRVESYNVREIATITEQIEDEELKSFLVSFLKQENEYDELIRRKDGLQLTEDEIISITRQFVIYGCTICTEFFLLQFKVLFDAEVLTTLAELAVKKGQLEILKVLHNHGAILLEDFLTNAIVNLDVPIVKYLVFLDVALDDNDAERLVDFLATRTEGYNIYLILEELMRSQNRSELLKDVLRLANEASNEILVSYLMRKNLQPIKEKVINNLMPIQGIHEVGVNVEAKWYAKNWRRWTLLNTRILKSLTDYKIITIDLSNNKLSNLIPEFFDGSLPTLSILSLNNNRIETLPDISYPCKNQIVLLDIKDNNLKELPFVYLCMPRIEQVSATRNKILRFTFWEEINITSCFLAAADSNLKKLDLSENDLDMIPEEIGQFRRMTELKCRRNKIEDIPGSWNLSSRLEIIDFNFNKLNCFPFQHPPGLWKMTVRTLLLANNSFTWIPQCVTKLRLLLLLDMNNNDLHEFPPDSVWECQLSELKLANNPLLFTREFYGISGITMYCENTRPNLACFEKTLFNLDISNNNLIEVPCFVISLKKLRFLYLNQNPDLNDLPPDLSLLQHLTAICVEGTPLGNLPPQYQPPPDTIYLNVYKTIKYLEEERLNSTNLYHVQLVIVGNPSIVLQRLELDILGISRKKLILDSPRLQNITMYDTQMCCSGKKTESMFSMKANKPLLKIRVWVIDNLDGYKSIKTMLEGDRTLYIITNDIAKRFTGCFEVKEWLEAVFDRNLYVSPDRISLLLDQSHQIEKDVQKEVIANIRSWIPTHKFHTIMQFRDADSIRKEVYNWGEGVCRNLKKVPEYMQKVLAYFENKEKDKANKDNYQEFVFLKHQFFGTCQGVSRGHIWTDKDKTEFTNLLQNCGYLFHCKDTWSNLDSYYFTKPNVFYDFILRFVETSSIKIHNECGKTTMVELREIIQCYSLNENVTRAIIAILERYELAFEISENTVLAIQFLHKDRPAIIGKSELMEFENSLYMQAKGKDRRIMEKPQYNRLYCFNKTPRHFFSLLIVYLTSHSKQAPDYQFKSSSWNLVLWKNGLEAFIGDQHILITQAGVDQLSNNILSYHIVHGTKIIDEQTLALRRGGISFFVSVAIYSKSEKESLKRLGNICDAIENLARHEQFIDISDNCCRMIPCNGCLEGARLHLLSVEELLTADGSSYFCEVSNKTYKVENLLPEYFLKDQQNDILIPNEQLNFNKNRALKIGDGAEGTVYKHNYKGQEVAVKLRVAPDTLYPNKSKEYLEMRKEAVLLQKLHHPYLMGIIAVTTSPLCLVLEYAAYSSLNKVLDYHLQEYGLSSTKNGVLGTILTHQIAIEVASALDYLHRNSIIYFDLKSANVLVMSLDIYTQLHVKLTDYGISEMIAPKGFRGCRGTFGFMAPELFPEEGVCLAVDQKVDVYSYAMFLCELLFGRNPAAGDRYVQENVRNGVRPKCSSKEIPFHMFNLIERCWEQLPQMRPSTSEILQELSEVKFILKNKASNINTRGIITGAYQMQAATLPSEKGIDLTKSMLNSLFPPPRKNFTLSNSSSVVKDLSGSYNSDVVGVCTPNLQSKFPHINQTEKYEICTDRPTNRGDLLCLNKSIRPSSDDSAVVISASNETETDIILMNMTTGEYFSDIRIEYPHVTAILVYNSFMWITATHHKGDAGVIMMYNLPQMNLMFEAREESVRKLFAFPIEETESYIEINVIVIISREIFSYQIQLKGSSLQNVESQIYDSVNFNKSIVYVADGVIGGACTVMDNELWLSYAKNNAAHIVVLDMSYQTPKVIDELPPIVNVVEIGDLVYVGRCIWLNDKRELNLWKIDRETRKIHEFTDLVQKSESKDIGRSGSIVKKDPVLSPTHKYKKKLCDPCTLSFQVKSLSFAEECRASREILPLQNVNAKIQQKLDYISQSSKSLRPGLEHIDIIDMFGEAGATDKIVSPIASLHAGFGTVWAFLEDGKICICDANTSFNQLSILCVIKTQAEFSSAKHSKAPSAITMTDSHVIVVHKAREKEVFDMDGFDYYVEVWQNLSADEIRCYNRVVSAAHRAV